jgi:hypothetical protein
MVAGEYYTAVNNGKAQNNWTEKQLPLFIEIGKELQGTYPFLVFEVPQKPTEKETPPLTKLPWQKDYQIPVEKWNKMDLEKQKMWLEDLDFDAEAIVNAESERIMKENEELQKKLNDKKQ